MNIVVLYGQNHKGSTYHITQLLLERLKGKDTTVSEFYTNSLSPCMGCFNCIIRDENLCPHRESVGPIIQAIEQADVVIAQSPNYCMGMSGQLKILFDHMAYRWMSHRPHPNMKGKIGVAISTTAGLGAKKVVKEISNHFFWWGIPKTYVIAGAVSAMSWKDVSEDRKKKIQSKVDKTAECILKAMNRIKPGIKNKLMFKIMRMQQKGNTWNLVDRKHWEKNGWIE